MQHVTEVGIRPNSSILNILSHLNYKAWFAVAEFVDNSLQSYFATRRVAAELTAAAVDDLVASMLELFRQAAPPLPNVVTGLWGELLIISMAKSRARYLAAWHSAPNDVFDFSFPDARLEVKTTQSPTRDHEFALAQVSGGRPSDYVLSIIVWIASTRMASKTTSILAAGQGNWRQPRRPPPSVLVPKQRRLLLRTCNGDAWPLRRFHDLAGDTKLDLCAQQPGHIGFIEGIGIDAPDVAWRLIQGAM